MIKKIRFIEPGYRVTNKNSLKNFFTYNGAIRNPATGLITLATIAKKIVADTLMYSESISEINFVDVYDADIVFISISTYNALRGYEVARKIKRRCKGLVVLGGMQASLNYKEAINHCDYVLTGDGDELIVEFINAVSDDKPISFLGVVYKKDNEIVYTGKRPQPENIDYIADRSLVHDYAKLAKKYDSLWPQVHASRGCNHNCAYCSVILHFGKKMRKRSPHNVVQEIKEAIEFHRRKFPPRLHKTLWLTDDNFPGDREWAKSVLNAIIDNRIKYNFAIQARTEIGFDDEMLTLMKKARVIELALGVEFLQDEMLEKYNKTSRSKQIVEAIANIRAHGIGVRALMIVGSETDKKGIGSHIAKFVGDNKLNGVLVQSMFFVPGTSFYEENKDMLIHQDWSKYDGNVIHYPKNIRPYELQEERIIASKKIYSFKRLLNALLTFPWPNKLIFFGDYFWQKGVRRELKMEMPYLLSLEKD